MRSTVRAARGAARTLAAREVERFRSPRAAPLPVAVRAVDRARAHVAAEEWEPAVERYEQALRLAGEAAHAAWWAELGRTRLRLEDADGAVAAYRRALDADPAHPGWWYRYGRALTGAGDPVGATRALESAIERGATQPRTWFHLGRAHLRQGRYRSAAYAFGEADRRAGEDGVDVLPTARLPLATRLALGLLERPEYAYVVGKAVELAAALGVPRISVIEFGVAGGNGLLALEAHAEEAQRRTGIDIDVYGFDTGSGLFAPEDERDMPYFFAAGSYAMDVDALRARLSRSELVLGDAAETFPRLLERGIAPIGAVSFDMDYHSATRDVLRVFGDDALDDAVLPRVFLYFDDVVGRKMQEYNRFAGELLAIDGFNEREDRTRIAEDRSFRGAPLDQVWHHGVHTMHRFGHARYNDPVAGDKSRALRLRD